MKNIKYTSNRNYRDFNTEVIKKNNILLNKKKSVVGKIKEKVASWFKI
jgi:hypothetical protein